jgi:protein transport protein SEC24
MCPNPQSRELCRDTSINKSKVPIQKKDERDAFVNLPSLPEILEGDRQKRKAYSTIDGHPPLSTTKCAIVEEGNSSPGLIKPTLSVVPGDEDLFDMFGLPLAVVIRPFNENVPVPEYEAGDIPRCKECGSFPSPFSDYSGTSFRCVICKSGNPLTIRDSPCFRHPTVDFILGSGRPAKYEHLSYYSFAGGAGRSDGKNAGTFGEGIDMRPGIIFGLDVSGASKRSGLFRSAVEKIKALVLSEEFSFLYNRFSIVTFGESVSVYSIDRVGVSVSLIKSVGSMFPEYSPIFINPRKSVEEGIPVREKVEEIFAFIEKKEERAVLLEPAMATCSKIAGYCGGAKVLLFLGSTPADIFMRPEKTEALRISSVDLGASFHLFVKDAEIGVFPSVVYGTNGSVTRVKDEFFEISDCINAAAFRCSVKVRASDGLRRGSIYANGVTDNPADLHFPEMSSNSAFSLSYSVEASLKEGSHAFVQCAIEHIGLAGEQRVRVMNIRLRVSRIVQNVFSSISFDAMFASLCKFIFSDPVQAISQIRKAEDALIVALALYKRTCAKETAKTQLVLPDTLKALPVLLQAVLKYPEIQKSLAVRKELSGFITGLPIEHTLRFFYPKLAKASEIVLSSGIDGAPSERLSLRVLDEEEIFVMENGTSLIMWIGKSARNLEGDILNESLKCAVEQVRECYGKQHIPLVSVPQGTREESEFIGYMVEDQMSGYPGYQEYLTDLHKRIQRA